MKLFKNILKKLQDVANNDLFIINEKFSLKTVNQWTLPQRKSEKQFLCCFRHRKICWTKVVRWRIEAVPAKFRWANRSILGQTTYVEVFSVIFKNRFQHSFHQYIIRWIAQCIPDSKVKVFRYRFNWAQTLSLRAKNSIWSGVPSTRDDGSMDLMLWVSLWQY